MDSIVENGDVSLAIGLAESRWDRAREAWEAITWIIAHDPTVGETLTESGRTRAYTLDGARSIDWPTVTVVYEIQEGRIVVVDARFEDAKYPQAGRA